MKVPENVEWLKLLMRFAMPLLPKAQAKTE
jgi:hypothetical protein